MVLTKRFKLLCAAAAAIGIYLLLSRPDPSATTVSAADSGARGEAGVPAASAAHATIRASNPDNRSLLARLAHRLAASQTGSFPFPTQTWYLGPAAPPPSPVT